MSDITALRPLAATAAAATLDPATRAELHAALERLESGRGLVVRLADLMGGALGQATRFGLRRIGIAPALERKLRGVAEAALARAYDIAILGLRGSGAPTIAPGTDPSPLTPVGGASARRRSGGLSRAVVMVSGATGGFVGMPGFLPDAGVTTLAIMRAIARIAREEGEDLTNEAARRACLEVFALRGDPAGGAESELGYYSARLMLQGRPLVLLLAEVGARYGLVLSQKFAAQMVPVAGALSAAAINAAFLAHYENLARAHFTIRRLERQHGAERIQATVSALRPQI